jgi:(E)-4-hydroxy-3-methylbut-2-enyl-diphosphate synthase
MGPLGKYCEDLYEVSRRKTRTVECGPLKFGSDHPIVRQTMATTDTANVEASIEQIMRCADKGFDLVRITVQGKREANAAAKIRDGLFKKGYDIPLCADMHFQPVVAQLVADAVEKIRINPGNFADGRKDFEEKVYESEDDYVKEREYLVEAMLPLVQKCKDLNRCMRIGTNHGSLSSRVLSYYGDTPRGMVESAIEFADICRSQDFHNFVFSMKASNPLVMVQSYRLLASEMYRMDWDYPLHLGVTEAGEGEDGRMKSAVGIGTLLADGLGDTVRVSLTEDPEFEYEPCNRLSEMAEARLAATNPEAAERQRAVKKYVDTRDITTYARRVGDLPEKKEGEKVDVSLFLNPNGSVISTVDPKMLSADSAPYLYKELGFKTAVGMPFKDIATSDSIFMRTLPDADDSQRRTALRRMMEVGTGVIVPSEELEKNPLENAVALVSLEEAVKTGGKVPEGAIRLAVEIDGTEDDETIAKVKDLDPVMVFVSIDDKLSQLHASRRIFEIFKANDITSPAIHHYKTTAGDSNELALELGTKVGSLLTDGNGDGILIEQVGETNFSVDFLRNTGFSLLQGCRMRNTKTEFVSCPSCGRTLFDLQETTAKIQEATGHLPGVTVAVMGCIVNGPGEMADADFGYVGTLPGKVDLYYGKEVVRKNIPNEEAVDSLVDLIKSYDMWKDKEEEEAEEEVAVAA